MDVGLLWFDDSRKVTPQTKLAAAAARYAERFGRAANCCHVHPDQLFADPSIAVVSDPHILPHHLWVGLDESLPTRRAPARVRKSARPKRATPRAAAGATAKPKLASRAAGTMSTNATRSGARTAAPAPASAAASRSRTRKAAAG